MKKVKEKEIKKLQEDFLDEKDKPSLLVKLFDIFLWVVLFAWMGICIFDFYNVSNNKQAMFCLKTETVNYDDGSVTSCLGAGYKAYYYNRSSYTGKQFGPFWIKDKSLN